MAKSSLTKQEIRHHLELWHSLASARRIERMDGAAILCAAWTHLLKVRPRIDGTDEAMRILYDAFKSL